MVREDVDLRRGGQPLLHDRVEGEGHALPGPAALVGVRPNVAPRLRAAAPAAAAAARFRVQGLGIRV